MQIYDVNLKYIMNSRNTKEKKFDFFKIKIKIKSKSNFKTFKFMKFTFKIIFNHALLSISFNDTF